MPTNSLNPTERKNQMRYYGEDFSQWPISTRENFINLGPRGTAGSEIYTADVNFINELKRVNTAADREKAEMAGPTKEVMKYYKQMMASLEAYSQERIARERQDYGAVRDETMATLDRLPKDANKYRQALEKMLKFARIQNKKKAILSWREQAKGFGKSVRSGPAQQQRGNIVNAMIGADRDAGVQTEIEGQRWTDERQAGLMNMLRSLMAGSDPTGAQQLNVNAIGGMGTAAAGLTQIDQYFGSQDFQLQLMQMQEEADRKANKFKWEDLFGVAGDIAVSYFGGPVGAAAVAAKRVAQKKGSGTTSDPYIGYPTTKAKVYGTK